MKDDMFEEGLCRNQDYLHHSYTVYAESSRSPFTLPDLEFFPTWRNLTDYFPTNTTCQQTLHPVPSKWGEAPGCNDADWQLGGWFLSLSASWTPTLAPMEFCVGSRRSGSLLTRLLLVTRWQVCKQSLLMQSANITSPVFPSGCYFISINLAAMQSFTKEGLTSGFCHLSHISVE